MMMEIFTLFPSILDMYVKMIILRFTFMVQKQEESMNLVKRNQ